MEGFCFRVLLCGRRLATVEILGRICRSGVGKEKGFFWVLKLFLYSVCCFKIPTVNFLLGPSSSELDLWFGYQNSRSL